MLLIRLARNCANGYPLRARTETSSNSLNDRGMPETNIRTDAGLQMENVGVPSGPGS